MIAAANDAFREVPVTAAAVGNIVFRFFRLLAFDIEYVGVVVVIGFICNAVLQRQIVLAGGFKITAGGCISDIIGI